MRTVRRSIFLAVLALSACSSDASANQASATDFDDSMVATSDWNAGIDGISDTRSDDTPINASTHTEANLAADEPVLAASELSAAQARLADAYWALRKACAAAETARSNDELWRMPAICGKVDAAYLDMNKGGVCFGKEDQPNHQYDMHVCRPGSIDFEDSERLPETSNPM